jgi:quinol monooxygenase YgiN
MPAIATLVGTDPSVLDRIDGVVVLRGGRRQSIGVGATGGRLLLADEPELDTVRVFAPALSADELRRAVPAGVVDVTSIEVDWSAPSRGWVGRMAYLTVLHPASGGLPELLSLLRSTREEVSAELGTLQYIVSASSTEVSVIEVFSDEEASRHHEGSASHRALIDRLLIILDRPIEKSILASARRTGGDE